MSVNVDVDTEVIAKYLALPLAATDVPYSERTLPHLLPVLLVQFLLLRFVVLEGDDHVADEHDVGHEGCEGAGVGRVACSRFPSVQDLGGGWGNEVVGSGGCVWWMYL